jgi:hypothetical protein
MHWIIMRLVPYQDSSCRNHASCTWIRYGEIQIRYIDQIRSSFVLLELILWILANLLLYSFASLFRFCFFITLGICYCLDLPLILSSTCKAEQWQIDALYTTAWIQVCCFNKHEIVPIQLLGFNNRLLVWIDDLNCALICTHEIWPMY